LMVSMAPKKSTVIRQLAIRLCWTWAVCNHSWIYLFYFLFFVWICICKCKFKQGFCVLQTESTISNYMKVSLQKGQLLANVKVLPCSYNGACMGLDCYYFMQKG
jgi:hypothetical protein